MSPNKGMGFQIRVYSNYLHLEDKNRIYEENLSLETTSLGLHYLAHYLNIYSEHNLDREFFLKMCLFSLGFNQTSLTS